MIDVNCYNCNSFEKSFYAEENGHTLVKCTQCGLIYLSPRPTDHEISISSETGLHKGDFELDVTGRFDKGKVNEYKKILKRMFLDTPFKDNKKWLDIGCGHGEFMEALSEFSERRLNIRGLEPNVKKMEKARKRGLDVIFFDIYSHEDKYDYISLLNVYSHLPNPKIFLSACHKLLNDNGELIIETGDTANLTAEEHHKPFSLPDHLSFASENILKDILVSSGFEILKVEKYPIIKRNIRNFIKECVKILIPRKKNRLKYMFCRKYVADMYIRAVKK
jgi:SAM-dependent methyltransferase